MSEIYSKNSINRFGDDLIEDILSYLSLEDKFRMECVSKQFQRCVYNRRSDLIINELNSKIYETNNLLKETILDWNTFAIILRKCRFIKTIEIRIPYPNLKPLIDLLTNESLNTLQEINIDLSDITEDEELVIDFLSKLGPKIRRLEYNGFVELFKIPLIFCPNLYHISVEDITDLFYRNQILVKNLKSISITYVMYPNQSGDKFAILIDNNMSLEKLEINCFPTDENLTNNFFKQITKLSHLKELKIDFQFRVNFSFYQQLMEICIKCSHLKRLSIDAIINSMSIQMEIFKAIQNFKNLTRIELRLAGDKSDLIYAKEVQSFGSKSLENWRNVTHLTLHLNGVCDSLFEDINIYLPKLQSIDILDSGLTFKSMESLAKLPKLQTLISNDDTCLTQKDIQYFIRKCREINFIQISNLSDKVCRVMKIQ